MAELFRYAAFISYSSKDAAFARRLHRTLESYSIPKSLGAFDLIGGGKKNRIYPVFRDREELSAGHLGELIEANLRASSALIVICSPNSAASPWVQKEIEYFVGLGRRDRVFAIIPHTAPLTDEAGADCTLACFPPAFRTEARADSAALEPLAADARKGRDGFRNAWMKVVAGMIGASPGQLIDRDKQRRRRQRAVLAASLVTVVLSAGLIAAAADAQRWRTRLANYADLVANDGRAREALPYAIAAMPGRGAALPQQGERAQAMLTRLGATRIVAELGELQTMRMSSTGAVAAALQPDMQGTAKLYDLAAIASGQGDVQIDLGAVGQPDVGGFLLSDNGRTLLAGALMGGGGRVAYDLDALRARRSTPQLDLGVSVGIQMSADGSKVVALGRDGELTWIDLDALRSGDAGARLSLGRSPRILLSADGARLVQHRGQGEYDLVQMVEGEAGRSLMRTAFSLPDDSRGLRNLSLSSDGKRLFAHDYDDEAFVVDLEHVAAGASDSLQQIGDLDAYWGTIISADGRVLLTRGEDGAGTAYDLMENGARIGLGSLGSPEFDVTVSHDGARAVAIGEDHRATLIDIRAALRGQPHRIDLGDVGEPRHRGQFLSGEGRVFVVLRTDRTGLLVDLDAALENASAATRELGDLGDVYQLMGNGMLSHDGSVLALQSGQGSWALYDLVHPVWGPRVPNGAALTRAVCDASGDGVRPFNISSADVSMTDEHNLPSVLAGRPRNPCDWRGLLAILPDAARGDGWFEGARQWLRLLNVRYFGGAEWTCEETISAASAATRARRREMCERFASQAAEPPIAN
ncbi:MAG: toll/interleukin-1 receptor domain-containing protein [Hyphomonadaceae bacterium]